MAMTGGTAKLVKTGYGNYGDTDMPIKLYVYYKTSQSAADIAANRTTLSVGMYVTTKNSNYHIGQWDDWNKASYVGRTTDTFDGTVPYFGGTYWIKENVSYTVAHNSDGTGKATIYWKWAVNSPWGQFVNPSGSFTIDLPTIPRASTVSAANGTIGSGLKINISSASSSFTHTLKYSFGGATGTITTKTTSTSVSWTPPMSLCSKIPSATSETCTITCETYSGTSLVGSKTCTMTLTVPDSVKLAVTDGWASVAAYNKDTAASQIATFVQGYSKAEVTFFADKISTANSYGATVKSYSITFNSKTVSASPYRTEAITTSGEKTITCSVTDTRGRTVSGTLTFTVHAYTAPTLRDISVYRCDIYGNANDEGDYIYVKATSEYSRLDGFNSAPLRVRYKLGTGKYAEDSYIELTSGTGKVLGNGLISTTSTYVVEVSVVDALGKAAIFTDYIPTSDMFFVGMDGGKGAAMFKYPEVEGAFDVGGIVIARDGLEVGQNREPVADFPVAEGVATAAGGKTWRFRKWHSGWTEMWARQTLDTGTFSGENGMYYSPTLTVSLPFSILEDKAIASVSVRSSGVTWATNASAWSSSVTFGVGRILGGTTSLSVIAQIYVAGMIQT